MRYDGERVIVEVEVGELTIRTLRRYFQPAFAIDVHLWPGYKRSDGTRRRWAFIQFGTRCLWLKRAS